MHQFVEKIITLAEVIGAHILKLLHQVNRILVTFSKKVAINISKISLRINVISVTFAKWLLIRLKQSCTNSSDFIKSNWPFIKNRFVQYSLLMRLDKPVGILLLLWPTLWALWIAAEGHPDLDVLLIFIFGVIVMRSTGCVINDLADRNLDRHVQRTQHRPITSGKVTPIEAMGLITVLLMCAVALVLNLNALTFKLSLVAVPLAIIYPFMKRVTYLPQVFLGLAFAWAIPMAFAAQTNSVPEIAWLLFITTVLWAVVYDTMYAMVDREDDIKIGVKTTAILFDDADRTIIALVQIMILLSQILAGVKLELGKYYYAGIAIASLLSIYQQYLIKDRIPENCFRAFLNNQWYGMVIFVGLYLHYMFG
ncbi:MAG: 4-hydroxybenzoate octaprenyltransferase [Proteobacteria bacterium]|nr:4-hydroxybenzoate octaprenyltransferase [Pseudomonadota bacterium]